MLILEWLMISDLSIKLSVKFTTRCNPTFFFPFILFLSFFRPFFLSSFPFIFPFSNFLSSSFPLFYFSLLYFSFLYNYNPSLNNLNKSPRVEAIRNNIHPCTYRIFHFRNDFSCFEKKTRVYNILDSPHGCGKKIDLFFYIFIFKNWWKIISMDRGVGG